MSPTIQTENGSKTLNIPCGCGNRKEIMGAGEWQRDVIILLLVFATPILIVAYQKWVKE